MEGTEIRKLAELERRHWWYRERRELLRRMVKELVPATGQHVALDIGAAGGGNTAVLEEIGLLAIPIEYTAEGAEVARSRDLPAVRADGRHLPIADEVAQLVVAFDVLEHIEDHVRIMCEIQRVLRPGGVLLVAVPADMDLWSAHDEAVGHVRRYTRQQLEEVTKTAGLVVQDIWSWNVLMRGLVAWRRRRREGSHLEEMNRFLNAALGWVIALERRMSWVRQRRGVSLMMIATRRP